VLDFLERTALDAQVSSDEIRAISNRIENKAAYPANQLGNSLKLVAKLIGAACRRGFLCLAGRLRHAHQSNQHPRTIAQGVRRFGPGIRQGHEEQGNMSRVMLMTFQRIWPPRFRKTPAPAPTTAPPRQCLSLENKVKAGVLGQHPGLAPGDLFQGDLNTAWISAPCMPPVLENWLQTNSQPILGKKFTPLGLCNAS